MSSRGKLSLDSGTEKSMGKLKAKGVTTGPEAAEGSRGAAPSSRVRSDQAERKTRLEKCWGNKSGCGRVSQYSANAG